MHAHTHMHSCVSTHAHIRAHTQRNIHRHARTHVTDTFTHACMSAHTHTQSKKKNEDKEVLMFSSHTLLWTQAYFPGPLLTEREDLGESFRTLLTTNTQEPTNSEFRKVGASKLTKSELTEYQPCCKTNGSHRNTVREAQGAYKSSELQ